MRPEKVGERIYLIDTVALGIPKTVGAYLIADEKNALIDVGYASSLNVLLAGIREAGVNPADLDYIILTHVHLDHAGCAGQLAKLIPKAVVYAHPRGAPHLVNPSKLVSSVRQIYGEEAEKFGETLPIPAERVVEVSDGEEVNLGSTTLRFIHAPGHAPHHMVIYAVEERALLSGDALPLKFPYFPLYVPTTPPPSYRHELAVETIRRLSELDGRLVMRPQYGVAEWSIETFEEQVRVLEWWKELVLEVLREWKDPLQEILKEFARQAAMKITDIPPSVKQNLRLSFYGMKMYLEKSGLI